MPENGANTVPKSATFQMTQAVRPTRVMTKSGHTLRTIQMIMQTKRPANLMDSTVRSSGGAMFAMMIARIAGMTILRSFTMSNFLVSIFLFLSLFF